MDGPRNLLPSESMADAPNRSQIAAALREADGVALPGDADAMRLWLDVAGGEGVGGLLAKQWLRAFANDAPIRAVLMETLTQGAKEELARQAAERRVVDALRAAELPLLVLKGAALSRWLYVESHLRPRCDLDLLFRDETDVERAQALLAPLGYAWDGMLGIGPAYERTLLGSVAGLSHQVDAHWRMANHPAFAELFGFDELLQRAQPIPDLPDAFGLSAPHALIHACLHRVANMLFDIENRLIWLYDIHLLARSLSGLDWSEFAHLAVGRGVAGPCLDAFDACAELLGTTTPTGVRNALETAAAKESYRVRTVGRRRSFEQQLLRALPWRQRPAHVLQKLLPPFAYMRQRYGIERRSQLPWAYFRRALDAVKILVARDRAD